MEISIGLKVVIHLLSALTAIEKGKDNKDFFFKLTALSGKESWTTVGAFSTKKESKSKPLLGFGVAKGKFCRAQTYRIGREERGEFIVHKLTGSESQLSTK